MSLDFQPGSLVSARGREWIVLPGSEADNLHLRPLGAGDDEATLIHVPLERQPIESATFPPPDLTHAGTQAAGLLLRDAIWKAVLSAFPQRRVRAAIMVRHYWRKGPSVAST